MRASKGGRHDHRHRIRQHGPDRHHAETSGTGETVSGTDFTTAQGGKGANQALAAQRAGAAVKMCGAVGNDAFASEALALLGEAGADLELVRHVEGPTGTH
jgi:sugar/nucleoside kinase (ribokinase family)